MRDKLNIVGVACLVLSCVGLAGGCANARYDAGYDLDSYRDVVGVRGLAPIAQSKKYQCGYACLASVAIYYNVECEKLVDGELVAKFGGRQLSGKELVAMAKALGLIAFAYEGSLEDVSKNLKKARPVIVLLRDPPRTGNYPAFEWAHDVATSIAGGSHWVIVIGIMADGRVVIQDPRKGRLVMSGSAFLSEWKKESSISVLVGVGHN